MDNEEQRILQEVDKDSEEWKGILSDFSNNVKKYNEEHPSFRRALLLMANCGENSYTFVTGIGKDIVTLLLNTIINDENIRKMFISALISYKLNGFDNNNKEE